MTSFAKARWIIGTIYLILNYLPSTRCNKSVGQVWRDRKTRNFFRKNGGGGEGGEISRGRREREEMKQVSSVESWTTKIVTRPWRRPNILGIKRFQFPEPRPGESFARPNFIHPSPSLTRAKVNWSLATKTRPRLDCTCTRFVPMCINTAGRRGGGFNLNSLETVAWKIEQPTLCTKGKENRPICGGRAKVA